ncbi:MAG: carboxylating nicotinate-nucleotide diphosphorylase [Pseudomonadota bacterium]
MKPSAAPLFPLSRVELNAWLEAALGEDLADKGDITTAAVMPQGARCQAAVVAREALVAAGLPLAAAVFRRLDSKLEIDLLVADGDVLNAGAVLMRVQGNAHAILMGERAALNALQHLSGIATRTHAYVRAIAGTSATLLDTRKTIPGWRKLAKYACRCGGADNHRMGLYDAVLIKDNHVAACGGITPAVAAAKAAGHAAIEVECDTLIEVDEALAAGASRILLDNMALDDMRAAVRLVAGRVPLEASGGVSLETIRAIAETGVNFISVGSALTLSAPAIDIGLDVEGVASENTGP